MSGGFFFLLPPWLSPPELRLLALRINTPLLTKPPHRPWYPIVLNILTVVFAWSLGQILLFLDTSQSSLLPRPADRAPLLINIY